MLKSEIRYQKFIIGRRNLKLGSLEEMVVMLKESLGSFESELLSKRPGLKFF